MSWGFDTVLALVPDPGAGHGRLIFDDPPKATLSAVSADALLAVGRVLNSGKHEKYGYLDQPYSVQYDAALRHLLAFWSGQNLDPESGEHHLAHAAARVLNLLAVELDRAVDPEQDDRR